MDTEKAKIEDGTLIIPEGTTEWWEEEYAGRTDFSKISFPERLTYIGYEAFQDCTALTEVIIPAGVTGVGQGAFACCTELEKLVVLGDNTKFESGWDSVFRDCNKLKDVQMSAAAWELNWDEDLESLDDINPFGGLSRFEVFSIILAKQTEQFLSKQKTHNSDSETTVQANIFDMEFGGNHDGKLYFLSICLKNGHSHQRVTGFEIYVDLCQGNLELLDYYPLRCTISSSADLVMKSVGSYRIEDAFELKKNKKVTREYSIAYRPWKEESNELKDQYALLYAIYSFRVRAIFANDDNGMETFSAWSPNYVGER